MSLNQKRTYSAPSFSICFRTSFRAPGSEVARSLLSIIAIARCSFVATWVQSGDYSSGASGSGPWYVMTRAASSGPLELPAFLGVPLAGPEDEEAERDGDRPDHEQRPDVRPHESRAVEDLA